MYVGSDAYPELSYSVAAERRRDQQQQALRRRARRDRLARRATRVRALFGARHG